MVFENVAVTNSTRFKTYSLKFSLVRLRKRFIESFSLDSFYFRILSLPLLLSMCNYFYYLINLLFFSSFNLTELVEKIELFSWFLFWILVIWKKKRKKKESLFSGHCEMLRVSAGMKESFILLILFIEFFFFFLFYIFLIKIQIIR